MDYHSIQFTYFELKYLLEYLSDSRAKQVYLANCLANSNLNEISRRISYLDNSEDIIQSSLQYIENNNKKFQQSNFIRTD